MVPEAPLAKVDDGLVPQGEGWFVLNVRDARWMDGVFGAYTQFEGETRFGQIGVGIGVLNPGQPACMYHGEADQEGFLVLSGECLLLVEGQERPLKQWDFVHCAPWTEHVFVGAGSGPCAILAFGGRTQKGLVYPVSELAATYGASVPETTDTGAVAYANLPPDQPVPYREGWLPG
jgi:uncharacterized cupin superfamily protein